MNRIILEDAEKIISDIDVKILEGKSFLITGASGLIGVYFVACLKQISLRVSNITVTAIVHTEPSPYLNDLLNFSGACYLKGDLTDVSFLTALPKADFIIHAAGYGQPLKFMMAPEKTLKLNTLSTFFLIEKLLTNGRFIFISSTEVYSGLKASKHTEESIGTTNTLHPRACYIEGKRGGEAICNAYRQNGTNAFSARLAHTYGPGAKKGDKRVLLSFIEKALAGNIEMLDDGKATRTYCYVADAVEVMMRILLFGKQPIYNVSGQSKTTIASLAQVIGGILQVPVIIPPSKNDTVLGAPEDVNADTYKVEQEFGKTTYVSLNEGLERTIKWYQAVYN